MKNRGEVSPPSADTQAVDLPDAFWEIAEARMPAPAKTPVNLRVDEDIVAFFKAGGRGHLTRMHAVLRAYVDAQKKRSAG